MKLGNLVTAWTKNFAIAVISSGFSILGGNCGKIDPSGTSINWEEIKTSDGPIVFLVNGFGGCAPCMTPELKKKLREKKIAVYDLDWNNIYIRRRSAYSDLDDRKFIRQMVEEVIPAIAPSRPIILIGHSFGGNALLKLAHQIGSRQITFLAVLDGVNQKYRRTTEAVAENIGYFYNRWTKYSSLPGGIPALPIPGTGYYIGAPMNPQDSGEITAVYPASYSNQKEQSYRYNADGSPILKYPNQPQIITHAGKNAIYQDAYIQQEMFDIILQILSKNPIVITQHSTNLAIP